MDTGWAGDWARVRGTGRPMITICMMGACVEPPPRPGWERPVAVWWR